MAQPLLLLCTEATPAVGLGHVMRCHAIAAAARERGLATAFLAPDAETRRILERLGEPAAAVVTAGTAPRFVVRDFRKGSDAAVVRGQVEAGAVVLLLDDVGPARTVAQLVGDAMVTPARARSYPHARGTTYLYGLRYAPLHRSFAARHGSARPGAGGGRLLISFGLGSCVELTARFVEALAERGFRGPATVVADGEPALVERIRRAARGWADSEVVPLVAEMAPVLSSCALVATKLGVTMLEAFCIGAGCVLIEPTPAHLTWSGELRGEHAAWAATELGLAEQVDFGHAAEATLGLLRDREALAAAGELGARLVDGRGADRIVEALLQHG